MLSISRSSYCIFESFSWFCFCFFLYSYLKIWLVFPLLFLIETFCNNFLCIRNLLKCLIDAGSKIVARSWSRFETVAISPQSTWSAISYRNWLSSTFYHYLLQILFLFELSLWKQNLVRRFLGRIFIVVIFTHFRQHPLKLLVDRHVVGDQILSFFGNLKC